VKIAGFCIRAERASGATAPTGSVGIQVQDFAGFKTEADAELDEGGVFMFHKPTGPSISGAGTLYVKLGGTTGYRVSVCVWFTE